MDAYDTGIRWSAHQFHTQLLPGTVPVCVDVMERFDAVRAARHERIHAATRAAQARTTAMPPRCPNCDHDLEAAPDEAAVRPDPPVDNPTQLPILDPHLPLQAMTLVIEAIAGRRPLTQLAGLATHAVLGCIRIEAGRTRGLPPRLHTLHVNHVDVRIAELFGTVGLGPRRIAYCARLDLTARGWRMTVLRLMRGPIVTTGTAQQHALRAAGRRSNSPAVISAV